MAKTKITSSEEREITSLLDQKRTPAATTRHLQWISKHLSCSLWKVIAVAKRNGLKFASKG